jgi:GTP cyclohydrolase II
MAAFRQQYAALKKDDALGAAVLEALEMKNLDLLAQTKKSQHIVRTVYGSQEGE